MFIEEATWQEIADIITSQTVAVIPTAAIEQHGPHLPLSTDVVLIEEFCRLADKSLSGIGTLVTPTIWLGYTRSNMIFPGTLTCSSQVFLAMLENVTDSLYCHGLRRFFLVNGHGWNDALVKAAANDLLKRDGVIVAACSYWDVATEAMQGISEPDVGVGHAGEFETACMLALRPEHVRREKIVSNSTEWRNETARRLLNCPGAFIRGDGLGDLKSEIGVYGDPSRATPEQGERLVELVAKRLAEMIRDLATVEGNEAGSYIWKPRRVD